MRIVLLILSLFFLPHLKGQEKKTLLINGDVFEYILDDCGDTIVLANFADLTVTSKREFASMDEYNKYQRYRRYAYQVYPYAEKAIRIFKEVRLQTAEMRRGKRKKYTKELQEQLKTEFETPLRNLSKTQGMILMKMIEKEVQAPMYFLIKDLRGNFTAFYWNTMGSFYGHKLKDGYKKGKDTILDLVLDDVNLRYGSDDGPLPATIRLPKKWGKE
jgi:hypothetical protein